MADDNPQEQNASSGDGGQQQSTNADEGAVTPTALQAALRPIEEALTKVTGDAKDARDSRAVDDAAAAIAAQPPQKNDDVQPSEQLTDAEFYNQGPAKSARSIADAAIKAYHEKIVAPQQKYDKDSEEVRVQRETVVASKSIEHLPNFADVKDKVHATMGTVQSPETRTNPEAWKRVYAMEIGMLGIESHEAKTTAALPVTEVGITREPDGPTSEQIETGRKLGLSKEDIEGSVKMLKDQDTRLLKAV